MRFMRVGAYVPTAYIRTYTRRDSDRNIRAAYITSHRRRRHRAGGGTTCPPPKKKNPTAGHGGTTEFMGHLQLYEASPNFGDPNIRQHVMTLGQPNFAR